MAAYPTLNWMDSGSDADRDGGILLDTAADGTPYTRSTYASDLRTLTAVHMLSQTDRDTLVSFYNTNKNLTFTLTIPATGEAVNARFIDALSGVDIKRPSLSFRYRVTVRMVIVS